MRSSLDCLPCFVAQGLKAARLTTSDEKVQERVLREVLLRASQANFESLEGSHHNIFFLFKAKCSVVAQHIGRQLGSLILHRNVPEAADRGAALPPTGRGKRNPPRKTIKNERIKL